jgi:beta-glucosidase
MGPDELFFGVAMSGYQVEGGFNGPGEPENNWVRLERDGAVEPSGVGVRWWDEYEAYIDRAAAMGCTMLRMGIEWARIEPEEGQVDASALDRYAAMVSACRERGMEPLVTVHHFTHPAWLGEDFWLTEDAPERFAAFTRVAVGRLAPEVRYWVTLNEINALSMATYLFGLFPPRKNFDVSRAESATGNMIAAHVAAYGIIHELREDAVVTTNNAGISIYELDRVITDLLLARRLGIKRDDVDGWIDERRAQWYGLIGSNGPVESAARWLAQRAVERGRARDSGRFPGGRSRALDAVYGSKHECTLDVVGFDYYDPVAAHHVVLPGTPTAGGRVWNLAKPLWDDEPDPDGLARWCHAHASLSPGIPVWIVENGMCTRVRNGRAYPRIDGWDRPRYIKENVAAVMRARDEGVDIGAYLHWSLVDNYEWGSYQPRFGIHGVDRERGVKVLDTDATGADAAGAYRRVIEGVRAGDRSVLT